MDIEISPEISPEKVLLQLKQTDTQQVWTEMLRTQYELSNPFELKNVLAEKRWHEAQSVLEVGFGDEEVVGHLKNYSQAQYVQVPLPMNFQNQKLLKANETISLIEQTVSETQQFDIIYLRFILQHLSQFASFVKKLNPYLKKGGTLIVQDAYDRNRKLFPECPYVQSVYKNLSTLQKSAGGSRTACEKLHHRASELGYWLLDGNKGEFHSETTEDVSKFFKLIILQTEIIHRKLGGQINQNMIWEELTSWIKSDNPYMQIGLYTLKLRKKGYK